MRLNKKFWVIYIITEPTLYSTFTFFYRPQNLDFPPFSSLYMKILTNRNKIKWKGIKQSMAANISFENVSSSENKDWHSRKTDFSLTWIGLGVIVNSPIKCLCGRNGNRFIFSIKSSFETIKFHSIIWMKKREKRSLKRLLAWDLMTLRIIVKLSHRFLNLRTESILTSLKSCWHWSSTENTCWFLPCDQESLEFQLSIIEWLFITPELFLYF